LKVALLVERRVEEGMEGWKMFTYPSSLPLMYHRCDQPGYSALKTMRINIVVPNELTPVD
jgi:hypothetical protein